MVLMLCMLKDQSVGAQRSVCFGPLSPKLRFWRPYLF